MLSPSFKDIKIKTRSVILSVLSIILIVGIFFIVRLLIDKKNEDNKINPADIIINLPKDKDAVFINDGENNTNNSATTVNKGTNTIAGTDGEQSYASENFKAKKISFGISESILYGDEDKTELKISDIKSDWISSTDSSETKLLIVWKTSKLAKSEVVYSSSEADKKSLVEGNYGFTHAVVISNLEFSKRYVYRISVEDKWGNKFLSEEFAAFTSGKKMSVVDLISTEINKIFGWALRK